VQKTYFAGGSTGGREALIAVTHWPQDFDGAIALYPAWNAASLDLQFGRLTRELAKPGAYRTGPSASRSTMPPWPPATRSTASATG
jgi:hypothetical protein